MTVTPSKASGQESRQTKVSTLCITGSQCRFGVAQGRANVAVLMTNMIGLRVDHVIQDAMRSLHSNDYSINAPATWHQLPLHNNVAIADPSNTITGSTNLGITTKGIAE